MRTLGLVLVVSGLAFGCNVSQEGATGQVLFTPDECGWLAGCDFADSIGVGGAINVNIQGTEGVSTAGLDLVSSDPDVFDVMPIQDVGGRPTWEIFATGAGVARLEAVDAQGTVIDFLEVPVQDVIGLRLDEFIGNAVESQEPGFDQGWTIEAGMDTSFYTMPLIAGDAPTMGRFQYTVEVDAALEAGMLEGAELGDGYYYFNVPPGDYTTTITNDMGVGIDVLFIAQ